MTTASNRRRYIAKTVGRIEAPPPMAESPEPAAHGKRYRMCGSRRNKHPGTCQRPAGWGTPHPGWGRCKLHGGSSPDGIRQAQRLGAAGVAAALGVPVPVHPVVALEQELARTNGRVRWLAEFIAAQDRSALVWGVAEKVRRGSGEFPGTDVKLTAAPSVWLAIEQVERKHLADLARSMVSLGIDAKRLELDKRVGEEMVQVMTAAAVALMDRLGLSGERRAQALRELPALVVEQVLAAGLATPRAALPRGGDR